jgi:hypothetical protein
VSVSRKALCAVYALIGIAALLGTWANVLGSVQESGFWAGTVNFWRDTLINGSSRFITVDILFLGLTVVVWMVLEARRLAIPGVWVYVVLGLLIAISLTVPLFMIHREIKLAGREPDAPAGSLRPADAGGIGVLALLFTGYALLAWSRS